jgi:hypothetical protein
VTALTIGVQTSASMVRDGVVKANLVGGPALTSKVALVAAVSAPEGACSV